MLFIPLYWLMTWLTGNYTLAIIQTLIILAGGLALNKLLEFKTSNKLHSILSSAFP
jgi:hypothetical protein